MLWKPPVQLEGAIHASLMKLGTQFRADLLQRRISSTRSFTRGMDTTSCLYTTLLLCKSLFRFGFCSNLLEHVLCNRAIRIPK